MKTVRLIAALLALTLVASGAWAEETIKPGYWESVDSVGFPLSSTKTDRRCITRKDVAKVMEGPSNHIYSCDYPDHTAGGGEISFRGTCVDKHGLRVGISGHGSYTPTTLAMTATVKVGPLAVTASTDAHRIGDDCPAPGGAAR